MYVTTFQFKVRELFVNLIFTRIRALAPETFRNGHTKLHQPGGMSKHTVKLANRQEVSVYDKDISDHVRQIEKYRQLCLANSRRQRQQELVSLSGLFLQLSQFSQALMPISTGATSGGS